MLVSLTIKVDHFAYFETARLIVPNTRDRQYK